jgi:glycosyltransferase involved in cell wall biosynthesis
MESVGLTTLEALASGCVCAGFTGGGGRQYATPDNGFWVEEDDCLAAADAVAQAISLVRSGGAPLRRYVEAGLATAQQWSYAAFRAELEAAWSRLAPEARSVPAG